MERKPICDIPIGQIRVVNPRARSKAQFKVVTSSIAAVGLKKPITVARRPSSEDGMQFDLVVGQGRMEAFLALGQTSIPANVIEAPKEDQLIMSLVENIARRSPSSKKLFQEIASLKSRGYGSKEIAGKLGYDLRYISAIAHLIERDQVELCEAVEANRIPVTIALAIADTKGPELQRALSEAYESGELRGKRFQEAKRLIARRELRATNGGVQQNAVLNGKDLVREYERRTREQQDLAARAASVRDKLLLIRSAMKSLFADDEFVKLLRAEGLLDVPAGLGDSER